MADCGSVLHLHNLTLKPGTIRAVLGQIVVFCEGVCSLLPDLHSSCSESGGKMMQTTRRNRANEQDHQRPPFVRSEFPECVCVCDLCFSSLSSKLTVFSYKPLALAPGLQSQMGRPTSPVPATPCMSQLTPGSGRCWSRRTGKSLKQGTQRTFTQVSKKTLESDGMLSLRVRTVHVCRIVFINQTLEHNNTCRVNVCRRSWFHVLFTPQHWLTHTDYISLNYWGTKAIRRPC